MNHEIVEYNNKIFTIPEISKENGCFGINLGNQIFPSASKFFGRVGKIWNQRYFNEVNRPTFLGKIQDWNIQECTRVLDMPIKFPNSSEFKIPNEFKSIESVIKKAVDFENSINPNFEDYYCYLTVDNSYVEENSFQRNSGFHVDGFQGSRIKQKLPIDRCYIICDHTPTLFTNCSFDTSKLSTDKDNFFEFFDQVIGDNFYEGNVNTLTLIDAFCVHAAQKQKFSGQRSFIRISFTVREFDRLGNTHNPFFEYDWNMVVRDFQDTLK